MTAQRWCIQCGQRCKGRQDLHWYRIKDETAQKLGLKNPAYQFVHVACASAFEANLAAGREKFLLSYIPKIESV